MPTKNRHPDPLARELYADLDAGRDPIDSLIRFLKRPRSGGYAVAANVIAAMRAAATGPEADKLLPLVRALDEAVAKIKDERRAALPKSPEADR